MAGKIAFTTAAAALLLQSAVYSAPQPYCKPVVGSSGWPSASEWQALNTSVSGRLIAPEPPGLVCHSNSSVYSTEACGQLAQSWTNSSFHASDPFTVDYNDESCLPSPEAPCSAAAIPAYVVNATNAGDVQAACTFANRTGVRLIVKGTGHDFPGRSSGRNSLSIWTHNIRGVNVTMRDARAVQNGGVAAVRIGAGMRFGEIYAAVAQHNLTLVGGADPNVGIGGWVTGGGHSPISSVYGLGADQVLEMEVVTADGRHLTINETSYPGLFWAMRGGGGSTFAVMISVTVRAFPVLPLTLYAFSYNTTANSDTFWSLVAYFHNKLPDISDKGAMGYYFIFPNGSAEQQQPDPATQGMILGGWFVPNKTVDEAQKIFAPMEQAIRSRSFNGSDPVFLGNETTSAPDFTKFWLYNPPQTVGASGRLGSRLLGRKALKSDPQTVKKLFKQTASIPQYPILGHLVAGLGVKNAKIPGGNNSVLPAWRDAYTHIVLPRAWTPLNETEKTAVTTLLREVEVQALRDLAPDSGAYVNEADPTEPNWRSTFWGSNYPRLLELKNYWDPNGVFWCIPCVGHAQWNVVSDYGIEGAIGQTPGRICKG